jgi:hypothetical protein
MINMLAQHHCLQSFARGMTKAGMTAVVLLRFSCCFKDKKMEDLLVLVISSQLNTCPIGS